MWVDADSQIVEDYCDYCEREGHTFRACPARDDEMEYDDEG